MKKSFVDEMIINTYQEADLSDGDDKVNRNLKMQFKMREEKLWKNLSKSVLKVGIIDHLFEKHYDSDCDDCFLQLAEDYVKAQDLEDEEKLLKQRFIETKEEKKKRFQKYYHEEDDVDPNDNKELKQFKRKRKNLVYKKRILRDQMINTYNKLNIMIKLRILQGPLFIYALLESIKL